MQTMDRPTTPPRANDKVRCRGYDRVRGRDCDQVLAERVGDCYIVLNKGRRMIVREILTIQCETCGESWKPGEGG